MKTNNLSRTYVVCLVEHHDGLCFQLPRYQIGYYVQIKKLDIMRKTYAQDK